jgi:hypothetical protein
MGLVDRRKQTRRREQVGIDIDRRGGDRRGADRRTTTRVTLELWMEEVSGDDVYFRRSGNLSEGGVFFDRAVPHALGTMVTLKFALPGNRELVVARGEVVSAAGARNSLGMGVRFITVEGNGLERMRAFIRRIA